MRRAALLAALLCACAEPQQQVPAERPSAETPAPSSQDTGDVAARFAQRVPRELLVREGACPFECCVYGSWTAQTPIPIVAEPNDTGAPVFTLQPGAPFNADSGFVRVTGPAIVVVTDTVGDPPYWGPFTPGDTLVVLDYIGEGYYRVWHEGRTQEVQSFWESFAQPRAARLIGEWRTEWWVHVRTDDGRTGWFHADDSVDFGGADACGG